MINAIYCIYTIKYYKIGVMSLNTFKTHWSALKIDSAIWYMNINQFFYADSENHAHFTHWPQIRKI